MRYDYEYVRIGTANVFMTLDVHRPWRYAKVTEQRTAVDFAECMRDLVDRHYPKAELIRVVLDNLSTHTAASLYESFTPEEARRILRRSEFHYTPKHASWLNMVEIEIGVMVGQCLDRRIPDMATLVSEIAHWERRRNAEKPCISGSSASSALGATSGERIQRRSSTSYASCRVNRSNSLWRGTSRHGMGTACSP